jgi:hypothetical protein
LGKQATIAAGVQAVLSTKSALCFPYWFVFLLQASSASLASQLADAQALAARERQLMADKAAAAEQLWHERNKELLEQVRGCKL